MHSWALPEGANSSTILMSVVELVLDPPGVVTLKGSGNSDPFCYFMFVWFVFFVVKQSLLFLLPIFNI